MSGHSGNMYIIGESLLKNMYVVYDFDNLEILIGVNVDSRDNIKIYWLSTFI